MKYAVVWSKKAERALAEIWLDALDRNEISRAARAIDRELTDNPVGSGESRDAGQRILFSPPLGVAYVTRPQDMLVRVLRAWEIKPHKK